MGNKKTMGNVLLVVGIVILLVSLTADLIGIGSVAAGFGANQIIGTIVGVIAIVAGFVLSRRS